MSGRLPITEGEFARWMQSVEDRLKQTRRRLQPRVSSADAFAVGTLTAAQLTVTQQLGIGLSEPATTPGTVIGRVLVVDATGVEVGYLPLYDTIT